MLVILPLYAFRLHNNHLQKLTEFPECAGYVIEMHIFENIIKITRFITVLVSYFFNSGNICFLQYSYTKRKLN